MLFKHLSGLSEYKVLTVTVALMRTVQYMSRYFLQCNVSSLAERRRTCCCVTEADSHKRQVWEEKDLERSVHCLQPVLTQENKLLGQSTS